MRSSVTRPLAHPGPASAPWLKPGSFSAPTCVHCLREIKSHVAHGMFPNFLLCDKQDLITGKLISTQTYSAAWVYSFWKESQKHAVLPCNWPKYCTLDVNCIKCLSLITPVIIYYRLVQAFASQHFSKEGLWVNLTICCHLINGWDLCSAEQICVPIWYLQYLKNISSLLPEVGAQRGLQGQDSADFTQWSSWSNEVVKNSLCL